MRICSFLPSATEIVYALGLQDQLYGVTFECDYPAEARHKPKVVRSLFEHIDPPLSSGAISQMIGQRLQEGLGIYEVDLEALQGNARLQYPHTSRKRRSPLPSTAHNMALA